jgi:hypothetical protein
MVTEARSQAQDQTEDQAAVDSTDTQAHKQAARAQQDKATQEAAALQAQRAPEEAAAPAAPGNRPRSQTHQATEDQA